MAENELDLDGLKKLMSAAGATQLYLKRLAENDNSKNQVYLGPGFTALNVLPSGAFIGEPDSPKRLKALLNFVWLSASGGRVPAPGAQLILYPQYGHPDATQFGTSSSSATRNCCST
jgi:hypothetical protein